MKQFYSLVYVKPNVLTDELILVGMIAGIQNKPFFYLSESRMRIVKKSMKVNQYESLKNSMTLIHNEISDLSRMPESLPLFDHAYSYDIIRATSLYKKNLLLFSNPSEIMGSGIMEISRLVKLIFNEKYHSFQPDKKQISFRSKWIGIQKLTRHTLRRKLTLNPNTIKTIFFPHQIDLLGVYGDRFVSFHGLDLQSAPRTIEKNVFEFTRLIRGLEEYGQKRNMQKGVHFLVIENPRNQFSKDLLAKLEVDSSVSFSFLRLSNFNKTAIDLELGKENEIDQILN
ncbi:MAG: hypothetical protein R2799_14020 [Crocinitomicaceae bacterium]